MTKMFVPTLIISLLCLFSNDVKSQTDIFKKAIAQFSKYKSFSYHQITRQTGPFSDETSILNIKTYVAERVINDVKVLAFDMNEARGYRYIANGSARINLDLNNKTFEISNDNNNEPYRSPFYWLKFMETKLNEAPEKIKQLSDTAIHGKLCYHIKLVMKGSDEGALIYDLFLDKKTFLPVSTKEYIKGKVGKGDVITDKVMSILNEDSYTGYQINPKKFDDPDNFQIPSNFKPYKKLVLLKDGVKAPEWSLKDVNGKSTSNTDLKGKIVLLDFSFNACPACILALPSIKNLHQQFKDIKILTINTSDGLDAVKKYIKKHEIDYPILVNGSEVSKAFQVSAFPTFYLIDQQGNVAATIQGYSESFEKDMTIEIKKLMNLKQRGSDG